MRMITIHKVEQLLIIDKYFVLRRFLFITFFYCQCELHDKFKKFMNNIKSFELHYQEQFDGLKETSNDGYSFYYRNTRVYCCSFMCMSSGWQLRIISRSLNLRQNCPTVADCDNVSTIKPSKMQQWSQLLQFAKVLINNCSQGQILFFCL